MIFSPNMFRSFFLITVFFLIKNFSFAQCTNAPDGQWPLSTYVPAADNSWEYITTIAYSGEYSVVAVTSGQRYQFLTYRSANGSSRYLTITDEFDTPIVWGTTTNAFADTVGWTATFTGNIKFFTHTNSGCGTNTQSSTRAIRGVVPPPVNDDPSGAIELIYNDPLGYRTFSNLGATNTTTESTPSCASYNGGDVWFYVDVPNGTTTLDIDTQTGDITDGGMSAYRGTLGSLIEIECDDDDGSDGLMPYIYREDYVSGERIYIRFWEYGGNVDGTFDIFVSGPVVLPITLSYFGGTCNTDGNDVMWVTSSESNSSHFTLKRSIDGESWEEVGHLEAAGNSSTDIEYSVKDKSGHRNPISYYRLHQFDYNNDSAVYGPISVACDITEENTKGSLSPNPSVEASYLTIENCPLGEATITLMNISGEVIYTERLVVTKPNDAYFIDALDLARGSYIIRFVAPNNDVISMKLVKN